MSEKEKTSEAESKDKRFIVFWGYCLAGILFWVLLYIFANPLSGHHPEIFRRAGCAANLSAIGKAQALYQAEHFDRLPSEFGELIPGGFSNGFIEMQNFVCPSARDVGLSERMEEDKKSGHRKDINGWIPLINSESDYILVFRHSSLGLYPPDGAVQIYELPENHVFRGDVSGINMMNVNGSVTWADEFKYQPQIQESHDILNNLRKIKERRKW